MVEYNSLISLRVLYLTMDILERLEKKDAMRSEYRRREELLRKHNISCRCVLTEAFNVPCGMPPAVAEKPDGEIYFYHEGCCSEAHSKLYDVIRDRGDGELKKRELESAVKKTVGQFQSKIQALIEEHGRDSVFEFLNTYL